MARLIQRRNSTSDWHINLETEDDEEIPPEMVLAWAALRQSEAAYQMADNLGRIANELTRILNNIKDVAEIISSLDVNREG